MNEWEIVNERIRTLARAMGCDPTQINRRFVADLVRAEKRSPDRIRTEAADELARLFR